MADNHHLQPDDEAIRSDEVRRSLGDLASVIDVGDLSQARARVDTVVGRRRTRKRASVALAAVAVIAAATTAVLTIGSGEPDRLVTSDRTDVPVTAPGTTVEWDTPVLDLQTGAARPVALLDGVARGGSVSGENGAPEYGEWVVPWNDGFLVGSTSFPPQPLPAELPDGVLALFPQEVIDVFGGELPDTIEEATDQLSAAGLLEVVSDIMQANPAASEAIYGAESTELPTLEVRFTRDGVTWEPREIVSPPGATYLSSVTAVDDRLVAVYDIVDPLTGMPVDGTTVVATTTDLENWTTQDIATPPPGDLPAGFNWSVSPQHIVANDHGWLLEVYSSVDVDVISLLPDDVRGEIEAAAGIGVGTDDNGFTVEYGYDDDGNNPATTRTFSWAEVGVAPSAARLLFDQESSPTLWAAQWDGEPAPTDAPPVGGPIAVTAAGFVQWADQTWFSPDGITWTAGPLPDGAAWVTGAFTVDDGLIVMSSTPTGESLVHHVDERGGDAVLLDLPLPAAASSVSSTSSSGSGTSGAIVAIDPNIATALQLSVEVDGYRLSVQGPTGVLEVVDIATGEVVASGTPFPADATDSPITMDENGITVTDPSTGEVLVLFPTEVLDAADRELSDRGGDDHGPDFWLVASLDGEHFVVDHLASEDPTSGPMALASNGKHLLVQSGTNWTLYDLT